MIDQARRIARTAGRLAWGSVVIAAAWIVKREVYRQGSKPDTCVDEEIRRLRLGLAKVRGVGHNVDCIFCGFKDRIVGEVLR